MIDRDVFHLQPKMIGAVRKFLNDVEYEHTRNKQIQVPRLFLNEGLRTYARQAELYAQGRTARGPQVTEARPGHSYHNFGLAVDVYPLIPNSDQIDWNFDPMSRGWQRVVALAKGAELMSGGQKWGWDWPHFQLNGAPWLWRCRKRWPRGWQV